MIADIIIVYAQNVGPQQFAVIYKALYEEGVLGNLSVQPISDNGTGCVNFFYIYCIIHSTLNILATSTHHRNDKNRTSN